MGSLSLDLHLSHVGANFIESGFNTELLALLEAFKQLYWALVSQPK